MAFDCVRIRAMQWYDKPLVLSNDPDRTIEHARAIDVRMTRFEVRSSVDRARIEISKQVLNMPEGLVQL
jgi:hypothetical protein